MAMTGWFPNADPDKAKGKSSVGAGVGREEGGGGGVTRGRETSLKN